MVILKLQRRPLRLPAPRTPVQLTKNASSPISKLPSELAGMVLEWDAIMNPLWMEGYRYEEYENSWIKFVKHWTAVRADWLPLAKAAFLTARTCRLDSTGIPAAALTAQNGLLSFPRLPNYLRTVELHVEYGSEPYIATMLPPLVESLSNLEELHLLLLRFPSCSIGAPKTQVTKRGHNAIAFFSHVEASLRRVWRPKLITTMDFHSDYGMDFHLDCTHTPFSSGIPEIYMLTPRIVKISPSDPRPYLEQLRPELFHLRELQSNYTGALCEFMHCVKWLDGWGAQPWKLLIEPKEWIPPDVRAAIKAIPAKASMMKQIKAAFAQEWNDGGWF